MSYTNYISELQLPGSTVVLGVKDKELREAGVDWNQNDSTALDYVKNRTHWISEGAAASDTFLSVHDDSTVIAIGNDGSSNFNIYGIRARESLTSSQLELEFEYTYQKNSTTSTSSSSEWSDVHTTDSSIEEGLLYWIPYEQWVFNLTADISSDLVINIGSGMSFTIKAPLEEGLYICSSYYNSSQDFNQFLCKFRIPDEDAFEQEDCYSWDDPQEGTVGFKCVLGGSNYYLKAYKIDDTFDTEYLNTTCTARIINATSSSGSEKCFGTFTWQNAESIFTGASSTAKNKIWVLGNDPDDGIYQYLAAYYIPNDITEELDFGNITISGYSVAVTFEHSADIPAGLYLQAQGSTIYAALGYSANRYTSNLLIPELDTLNQTTIYHKIDKNFLPDDISGQFVVNASAVDTVNGEENKVTFGRSLQLDVTATELLAAYAANKDIVCYCDTSLLDGSVGGVATVDNSKFTLANIGYYSENDDALFLTFQSTKLYNANSSSINYYIYVKITDGEYDTDYLKGVAHAPLSVGDGLSINRSTSLDEVNFEDINTPVYTQISIDNPLPTATVGDYSKYLKANDEDGTPEWADLISANDGKFQVNGTDRWSANSATLFNLTITSGSANGSIAVDGTDVAVKGLEDAAFVDTTVFAGALQQTSTVSITPEGTISVGSGTANYTPAGSVSGSIILTPTTSTFNNVTAAELHENPTFTGKEKTLTHTIGNMGSISASTVITPQGHLTNTELNTANAKTITGYTAGSAASFTSGAFNTGSLPSWTGTVSSHTLSFTWDAGSLPSHATDTFTANVPTAITTADMTVATGIKTQATFVGDNTTVNVSANVSGMEITDHVFTPEGTISKPAIDLTKSSVSYISGITGTVSALTFSGNPVELKFTGTANSHSHTQTAYTE